MVWAKGAVWEGAGAEGLVCTVLTPVLQAMAKGLCSAAGTNTLGFGDSAFVATCAFLQLLFITGS